MSGVPIGRIAGVEIRAQLAWVILLALIAVLAFNELGILEPGIQDAVGWTLSVAIAAGFFLSSLSHDLTHALVARRRGVPVSAITVSFLGGSSPLEATAPNPRDDLVIAISGPITNIVLAVLLLVIGTAAAVAGGTGLGLVSKVLGVLVVLNVILGFANLVPAYPFDGGRIVRAVGWIRGGSERSGWRIAARAGRLVGMLGVALGVAVVLFDEPTNGLMIALTGWFLVLSARTIADRVRVDELIGDLHVEDAMETGSVSVHPGLTVDTFASQLLDGQSPMTAVPVVRDHEVVGVLGAREVRGLRPNRWATTRVEDVMAKPPRLSLLSTRDTLSTAVDRLQRAGLDGLPVVDGGSLVGMLTRRSIGRLAQERGIGLRRGARLL